MRSGQADKREQREASPWDRSHENSQVRTGFCLKRKERRRRATFLLECGPDSNKMKVPAREQAEYTSAGKGLAGGQGDEGCLGRWRGGRLESPGGAEPTTRGDRLSPVAVRVSGRPTK